MMPLIQESINPCNLVIVYSTDIIHPGMLYAIQGITHPWSWTLTTYSLSFVHKSSMVRHLRHMYLIIRPQVIHGQAHSPTATYHPSTNHQWFRHPPSTCCLSACTNHLWFRHPPSASFFFIHPQVIDGSGTIVLPVFIIHPQVIYGSGNLVPPVANLHPQVI
jgi:hypothetical protein